MPLSGVLFSHIRFDFVVCGALVLWRASGGQQTTSFVISWATAAAIAVCCRSRFVSCLFVSRAFVRRSLRSFSCEQFIGGRFLRFSISFVSSFSSSPSSTTTTAAAASAPFVPRLMMDCVAFWTHFYDTTRDCKYFMQHEHQQQHCQSRHAAAAVVMQANLRGRYIRASFISMTSAATTA